MNRKSLLIASLLLGFSVAGASAHAFGGPGPGPGGGQPGMMQGQGGPGAGPGGQGNLGPRGGACGAHMGVVGAAYRVDNLSAEQRKQLDAVRDKERERMQQNRGDFQAVHEALIRGDDAAAIRPLAEKEGKQVTEMIMQQVELRDQVYKILTDAQRTQLKELLSQTPRQGRGGNRGPGGPGR